MYSRSANVKQANLLILLILIVLGCAQAPQQHLSITQRLEQLQTKDGKSLLEPRDIALLRATGADFETIHHLLSMENSLGESVFRPHDVAWFLRCGGTVEYAEKLAKYERKDGYSLFRGGQIAYLKAINAEMEVIVDLMTGGVPGDSTAMIFYGHSLVEYLEMGGDTTYAHRMFDLGRDNGKDLFCNDLVRLLKLGVTPEDVEHYIHIEGFQYRELIHFLKEGGTQAYAEAMSGLGANFYEIVRLNRMKVPLELYSPIVDTDKPNALFLFSSIDNNKEFSSPEAVAFYRSVWPSYDTRVMIIKSEEEIPEAFNEMERVDLLAICGHGNVESITICPTYGGDPFSSEALSEKHWKIRRDKGMLDTGDTELEEIFSQMPEDGVIFLDACETNKTVDSGKNLFNFIQSIAGGRRVIGAETIFTHDQIFVEKAYPLRLRFNPPKEKEEQEFEKEMPKQKVKDSKPSKPSH